MDLNDLALYIAKEEKGKEQVNIAQIKEILGILGRRWRSMSPLEVLKEAGAIRDRAGGGPEETYVLFEDSLELFEFIDRVCNIIRSQFDIHSTFEINAATEFRRDLDLDSLDEVDLVMAIEENFNVEVPDEAWSNIHTVKDVAWHLYNITKKEATS